MYVALAPIPLSTFAGEPTQSVGKSFAKSFTAVCMEGAIIVLACIIFSLFASSPPVINVNDVYDVLISAAIPYMDAVIMEKHQIDVLRQNQLNLSQLSKVKRYTLANLKQ